MRLRGLSPVRPDLVDAIARLARRPAAGTGRRTWSSSLHPHLAPRRHLVTEAETGGAMAAAAGKYQTWTKSGLIQRIGELEAQLRLPAPSEASTRQPPSPATPKRAAMDPARYSTRYIALKLAYLGKRYGGFEFQMTASLPSVEEELWKALTRSCLVLPDDGDVNRVQFDCCEYSKCGRTDRGVSAFGQVIGLRVRSNRPLPPRRDPDQWAAQDGEPNGVPQDQDSSPETAVADADFDPIADELCYPRILNRLLPRDIRVLAWCPSPPPGFSARFSCREREYRYFFTQPAFSPQTMPQAVGHPGWLDIQAMREAAKRFEGEHDFRNFCKIDMAKQITNFRRVIFEADIMPVDDSIAAVATPPHPLHRDSAAEAAVSDAGPGVYCFRVRGSAFLWHQIRHMVAILFLVGQSLESPSLVTELLDVERNRCKPSYGMADEVPLVLWDCLFPDLTEADPPVTGRPHQDGLHWIYAGDDHGHAKFGHFGLLDGLWELWRESRMDGLLAGQLMRLVSQQGAATSANGGRPAGAKGEARPSVRIYEGGNKGRLGGKYVPVMKKPLQQSPEEQNDRYAQRKGYLDASDMRAKRDVERHGADGREKGES